MEAARRWAGLAGLGWAVSSSLLSSAARGGQDGIGTASLESAGDALVERCNGLASQLWLSWRQCSNEADGVLPKTAMILNGKSPCHAVAVPLLLALSGYV